MSRSINGYSPVRIAIVVLLLIAHYHAIGQRKTTSQIKAEIEKSANAPLYVKDVLKKKFRIDTVAVLSTVRFNSIMDSLAYHGRVGKVYGPYARGKVLVQILAKAPGNFNRISQIFLDSSVFSRRFADSLANDIVTRIRNGSTTFEDMAQTYSMGGEAVTKGDLGWIAVGALQPAIEKELTRRKKGDIFTVWTRNGLHIIRKSENIKQDNGYALMMRVFL